MATQNTKAKIEKQLKGKTAFALNLGDGMKERIISNAREKIGTLQAAKEKIMPEYLEKKAFFEQVQKEYLEIKVQVDNIEDEVRKQDLLIDTFANFNRVRNADKKLILNGPKATNNGSPAPKKIVWLDEFANILATEGKFMSFDEVFTLVTEQLHVRDLMQKVKSYKGKIEMAKHVAEQGVINHALKTASGNYTRIFKPKITTYKDLIGLADWVDDKNTPLAPYMVAFTHGARVNPANKLKPVGRTEEPLAEAI